MSARAIILLDLDETIISCDASKPHDDVIQFTGGSNYLRPGTYQFLERIAARAHIALVTNKPHPYSDLVHAHLCSRSRAIADALGDVQEHELNRMRAHSSGWVNKHLNLIFCHVEDARRCILIDDDSSYVYANVGHAIPALLRAELAADWNGGLLGRILPLVEGALDAFEGSELQRQLSERAATRPGKRTRSETTKTRELLTCATNEHHGFTSCDICRGDKNARRLAVQAFSGQPVYNERVDALLHARMYSEHARFEQESIGRDDPIASYLVERAYGADFEAHDRAFTLALRESERRRAEMKAEHDALPEDKRAQYRQSHPDFYYGRSYVTYELNGRTHLASTRPACFLPFGEPCY